MRRVRGSGKSAIRAGANGASRWQAAARARGVFERRCALRAHVQTCRANDMRPQQPYAMPAHAAAGTRSSRYYDDALRASAHAQRRKRGIMLIRANVCSNDAHDITCANDNIIPDVIQHYDDDENARAAQACRSAAGSVEIAARYAMINAKRVKETARASARACAARAVRVATAPLCRIPVATAVRYARYAAVRGEGMVHATRCGCRAERSTRAAAFRRCV